MPKTKHYNPQYPNLESSIVKKFGCNFTTVPLLTLFDKYLSISLGFNLLLFSKDNSTTSSHTFLLQHTSLSASSTTLISQQLKVGLENFFKTILLLI